MSAMPNIAGNVDHNSIPKMSIGLWGGSRGDFYEINTNDPNARATGGRGRERQQNAFTILPTCTNSTRHPC